MTVIDFFKTGGWTLAEMTDAINVIPNQFGLLNELGLFQSEGVTQRSVIVEYDNSTLSLLVNKPVGAPGDANKSGRRLAKSFSTFHFPLDDTLKPEDLQGRRAFGSTAALDASWLLNKKLTEMRAKHDQTLEWLKLGVLKGLITDGAGTTLLNPYTDFGISQPTVAFALPTTTTEVLTKVNEVKRIIELALTGAMMTRVYCLCGKAFYDSLTTHPNVKAAFANWNALQNNYTDYRRGFIYGGVEFREYNGTVSDASGAAQALIGDNDAYFVPLGTNLFKVYNAPGNFLDTVNTVGLPFYAKQEMAKFDQGVEIHTESNPLALCLKPGVIVKGTRT